MFEDWGGAELVEEKNQLLHLKMYILHVHCIITNNHNDLKAIERPSQNLCFELPYIRLIYILFRYIYKHG